MTIKKAETKSENSKIDKSKLLNSMILSYERIVEMQQVVIHEQSELRKKMHLLGSVGGDKLVAED